jgi:hypothetical protein
MPLESLEQRAPVAALDEPPTEAVERRSREGEGGGGGVGGGDGDESSAWAFVVDVVEEAKQGRRAVERAVAAEEGGAREELAPGLADDGGAHEARWVIRWEAEEDLGGGVVY